jgi:hypothetical protein
MKILISILAISILTFSCSNDSGSQTKLVEFTEIAKGFLAGDGAEGIIEQNIVINNESDWNDLKTKMNTVNNETDKFSETEIDFTIYQIIAVFDQIYTNGGYSINITNISENETNIFVKIENLLKGNDTFIITQPYYLAKILNSDLTVILQST